MVIFILETMVPRVELEGVSAECANVSALPVTVKKLVSSVDNFYSSLRALEATAGLDVGGGAGLPRDEIKNKNRQNTVNDGNSGGDIVDIP